MRLLAFLLIFLALVVAKAPAWLVDRGLDAATDGGIRVVETEGSVWHGHGLVSVAGTGSRALHPWVRVDWAFDPFGLFRGRMAWRIMLDRTDSAEIGVGIAGGEVSGLRVAGAADNFLQRIPGPLGKFRWDGEVVLSAQRFDCSWRRNCSGQVMVQWSHAGSDFLPGQVFGDYELVIEGRAGEFGLSWTSGKASMVRVEGSGTLSTAGAVRLEGTVTGDPALLSRLPAVAGPWAKPTAASNTWRVVFP